MKICRMCESGTQHAFFTSFQLCLLYKMVTFGVKTVSPGENTSLELKEAKYLLGQTMEKLVVKKELLSED